MIETALVLPSPRALLPSLSAADPVPELRAACAAAIGGLLSEQPRPDRRGGSTRERCRTVLVVSPSRSVTASPGTCWGRGASRPRSRCPYTAAALLEIDEPTTLVVMADGSASRGEKAPGHLHPDAVAFDDRIDAALRWGDVDALAAIDTGQATELWCEGAPGFHVLAEVARGRPIEAEVSYADAPYGVAWWVARWHLGAGDATHGLDS